MSALLPNTFKGFGVALKQVFKKPITQQYPEKHGGNQVSPVGPLLFAVPSQRARRLSPGEARLRRELAALNFWLGTRS